MFKQLLLDLLELLFPSLCIQCSKSLVEGEKTICNACLPYLTDGRVECNMKFDAIRDRTPVERFIAHYRFERGGPVQKMIHAFKYKGDKALAFHLGQEAGMRMGELGELNGVDLLIPIPLHPLKQRKRGYNQSEELAKGIELASGISLSTKHLARIISNPSQTRLDHLQRWHNSEGAFVVNHGEQLQGKHILLIDDVFTSGATLETAARTLLQITDVKVSVFALAIA